MCETIYIYINSLMDLLN